MCKNGTLLIEIGTEELPINNLNVLGKDFIECLSIELKKKKFIFLNIKYYITLRRIACLVYKINYKQTVSKKFNIIYSPKFIIGKDKNIKKKLSNWIKNINYNSKKISCIKNKDTKIFFIKKKIIRRNIKFFINKILHNTILSLSKKHSLMRWGINDYSFVRPVNNLVVMYNSIILDVGIFGIKSRNILFGNRFFDVKNIFLDHAKNYVNYLFIYGKVIVDHRYRKNYIINLLNKLILINNFNLNYKEKFLDRINFMLEWPYAFKAKFNKEFLCLPKNLLSYVIKKYNCFSVCNKKFKLLNYFIIVCNINIHFCNFKKIISDYVKVIEYDLIIIQYLFKKDRKLGLIGYLPKLKDIIFHNKLGTYFDKIKRMLFLSRKIIFYLCNLSIEEYIIYYSILLIKCDLATSLCKEFNDLKGIIGMNYSKLDNYSYKISNIIKFHYYPNFSDDYISNDLYSNIVSLVDKLDTLIGISILNNFIYIKKKNDPYALRRLSILIIKLILFNKFNINIYKIIKYSVYLFNKKVSNISILLIVKFIMKRFNSFLIKLGYNKTIILSFLKLNIFNILDLKNRIDTITYFINKKRFIYFINLNKRIKNILFKLNKDFFSLNFKDINILLFKYKEEINLYRYIIWLKEKIFYYLNSNYYKLIYCFFVSNLIVINFLDKVKINVSNINKMKNRLILLNELNFIYSKFSDFSYYY